jgi:prevent-host-death family protein
MVRNMRYSTQVKPVSYLKANAAEVLLDLSERREPLIITQHGEAKAVMLDVATYEETQETLAFLKILALGDRQIEQGKTKPIHEIVGELRESRRRV